MFWILIFSEIYRYEYGVKNHTGFQEKERQVLKKRFITGIISQIKRIIYLVVNISDLSAVFIFNEPIF